MSLKASNKVDTNRYELEIEIDGATFSDAIQQVYRRNKGKINVPGFRKGKAPLHLIEKYYGEEVFFEDALNLLYSDALEAAAEEAGLTIIDDEMKFDLVSISKEGVDFKVTLTVKPEVELGEYKGLKADRVTPAVTDAEIEDELSRLADRNSRVVTVSDRAAKDGDMTVIDFEGFVDEKAFDGGKGEGYTLTLGSGQFIPGFEEQIVGHNTGDAFDVNVTFPTDYQAEELAGKEAVFKVVLHEIKAKELPVIDDEFAKDVSEFDTLDALKEDIKNKALERKEKAADEEVENTLIGAVVDGMKAEIPEAMFENRSNDSVREFEYRLRSQGMDLDTYLKYTGSSVEDLKKTFRPQSEKQVKMQLALEKIVELEKIEATEEEVAAEYEKLAASYGVEADQVKAAIPEKDVKHDIAMNKAIDLVKSSAEIKDVKEKTTKAAPKKRTTKKAAAPKAEETPAEETPAETTAE